MHGNGKPSAGASSKGSSSSQCPCYFRILVCVQLFLPLGPAHVLPGVGPRWTFARLRSGITSSEAVAFTCCDNVTASRFMQQMAWSTVSASCDGHQVLQGWSVCSGTPANLKKRRQGRQRALGAVRYLLLSSCVKIASIEAGEKLQWLIIIQTVQPCGWDIVEVGTCGRGEVHIIDEQRTSGQG